MYYNYINNLEIINFQKKIFGFRDHFILSMFEQLVQQSSNCTLETSCTFQEGKLYPMRFNLFFHDRSSIKNELTRAMAFVNKIEESIQIQFDYRVFHQFVEGLEMDHVKKIIIGLDLRENLSDSRSKIWFMLDDYPEKMIIALSLYGKESSLRKLIIHNELLIGFDFYMDGHSIIKIYPDIRQEELDKCYSLKEIFSRPIIDAMRNCYWIHINFRKDNDYRVLHFHPYDPQKFIEKFVPYKWAQDIYYCYASSELLDMVVSVRDSELTNQRVKNFSLYFMPTKIRSV